MCSWSANSVGHETLPRNSTGFYRFSFLFSPLRIPLFHCPQGSNFYAFPNTQSKWYQLQCHREDRDLQKGHPSTFQHHIYKPMCLCSHSCTLPPATIAEGPLFLTEAYPSTNPLPWFIKERPCFISNPPHLYLNLLLATESFSSAFRHTQAFSSLKPENNPEMHICLSPFHR